MKMMLVVPAVADFSVTFADPGTFTYCCGIHPSMTATIVVEV